MWMTVAGKRFAVTLADSPTAHALAAQLPLKLEMTELNSNEKYATLDTPLPTNATRPETIHSGDLLLYGADTLVIFYLTFKSSFPYTPIGRVIDPEGLAQALGGGDVRVVFSAN